MPEPRLSDIEASAVRQASGSGRLLADAIVGRSPEVDLGPYAPERFQLSV